MNNMPTIAQIHHGEVVTTTLVVAEGTQNSHAAVVKLVRKHLGDIEKLGEVSFQIRLNPQGRPTEFVWLNEGQAIFLLTLMRNSEIVVVFKLALVRAFLDLRATAQDEGSLSIPTMPTSVTHRADHVVAATRTFNGFMRVAAHLKLSRAVAARRANAAALKYTGMDIIGDLDADAFLTCPVSLTEQVGSDSPAADVFLGAWLAGELPVPCVACKGCDLYAAYVYWCRVAGVAPASGKIFGGRVMRTHGIRPAVSKIEGVSTRIAVPSGGGTTTAQRASEAARFFSALLAWQLGDPAG